MVLNVIYNEDCIGENGMKRLPDNSVDLILTDPPYNIAFKAQRKEVNNKARDGILNDNMSNKEFKEWLSLICKELDRVLKDNSYIFMFCGWSTICQFQPVLEKYWRVKALNIWEKNNFGIGYYIRPQYEPFFMCLKGKPPKPEKAHSDIWKYEKVYQPEHTCQKPVTLLSDIISIYGNTEQIIITVLDPFMGSGSTAVASLKLRNNFIGFEIDEEYYNMALKRIGKFDKKYYEQLPKEEQPRQQQLI